MSAHVLIWRARLGSLAPVDTWVASCGDARCPGWLDLEDTYPTHAEALAAAWAHIKEHS